MLVNNKHLLFNIHGMNVKLMLGRSSEKGSPHQNKENFISIYVRQHFVFEVYSNKV